MIPYLIYKLWHGLLTTSSTPDVLQTSMAVRHLQQQPGTTQRITEVAEERRNIDTSDRSTQETRVVNLYTHHITCSRLYRYTQ